MYKNLVEQWLYCENIDDEHKKEIYNLSDKELEDRFYKELEFGTGGLRGVMGSGTNRINIYTIGKVTQGYSNFLKDIYKNREISVAIAYDSRLKSDEFAKRAALIFVSNGIKVYLYDSLRPTPMLSFAVRELKCNGGIVLTASHNPKEYNGYKVYNEDGGQLTDKMASEVYKYISDIDIFGKINIMSEDEAIKSSKLIYIGEDIDRCYIDEVKDLSIRKDLIEDSAKDLKIVYTPLHGSGYMPITRVLKEQGYENLKIVEEQKNPDGNFSTVLYPNPELKEVFNFATKLGKTENSDVIFATDPDCDRVGVAVKNKNNDYEFLSGNQIGVLISEYILASLEELKKIPNDGVVVKTIVSTDVIEKICETYNIKVLDVLTGFKYIGEKIKEFEINKNLSYIFGFEESYGYLVETFVRDKDAVSAVNIICEMALYYKKKGKTLLCVLEDLYKKYGFYTEELMSFELKGKEGQQKITSCIEGIRNDSFKEIEGIKVIKIQDYKKSLEKDFIQGKDSKLDFPVSNVLKIFMENGNWFAIRPSGTEPKMKIYLSIKANDRETLKINSTKFKNSINNLIDKYIG